MRHPLVLLIAVAALVPQGRAIDEVVASWYPILHTGNAWVYAEEARETNGDHGIDDPAVGRWTTTETVSAVDVIPEGTHVTIRSQITDLVRLHGWLDDASRRPPAETELLVRGNCVYRLDTAPVSYPDDIWSAYDANHVMRPQFRSALLHGEVPAAFCFPMIAGNEWGRVRSTSPAEEDVWKIKALNGDPFGTPGARTFHIQGYQGSGDTTDYWFQQGVGIVQFVDEHHGTYDEERRTLMSATIDGVTRAIALQPARTPPLDPRECRAGWRHWIRKDGSLISNLTECLAYARGNGDGQPTRTAR